MAQLVKLEPGDVLVFSNVDGDAVDSLVELSVRLKEMLGVEHVLIFEGDVDLSKVPANALAGS
ncbi:hypothetical protein ACL02U_12055 [Streptomyces sp. MS06]|uniref:hypothetical protein n=1 Tax=Streptomyces sp. MS06 TaxID=3385974 RepID=UPI0039A10770